jgi:alkanesulfonate monooxygenase SsuD/methylene tetrahydromethanopterin reductase-like flavin-dependent oxidoreductase (luciferase family)
MKRTLRLAARYADEWNAVLVPVERYRELNAILDQYLDEAGRPRHAVRRTLMTRVVIARTDAEAREKLGLDPETARQRGVISGSPDAIVDQVGRLAEAGVSRLQAQWLDMDDIDGLELLATRVMSQVVA